MLITLSQLTSSVFRIIVSHSQADHENGTSKDIHRIKANAIFQRIKLQTDSENKSGNKIGNSQICLQSLSFYEMQPDTLTVRYSTHRGTFNQQCIEQQGEMQYQKHAYHISMREVWHHTK